MSETKIQQCEIVPALTNMSEQMSDVSEPDQIKYKQLTYCDLQVLPEECDFTQTGNVKHRSHFGNISCMLLPMWQAPLVFSSQNH